MSVSDDGSKDSNRLNLVARLDDVFSVESHGSFVQVLDPLSGPVPSVPSEERLYHCGSSSLSTSGGT